MDRWVSKELETEYVSRVYCSTVETTPFLLERDVKEKPKRIAVVNDAGRRVICSELDSLSSVLVSGLLNREIDSGDLPMGGSQITGSDIGRAYDRRN
jgi:non-ribosomal peptide synthetase component E (peptide arylation enzyme)